MECFTICKAMWLHKAQECRTKDAAAPPTSSLRFTLKLTFPTLFSWSHSTNTVGFLQPPCSPLEFALVPIFTFAISIPYQVGYGLTGTKQRRSVGQFRNGCDRQDDRRLFPLSLTLMYSEFWLDWLFEESCLTEGMQLAWGISLVFPRQGKTSGATSVAQCMADSTGAGWRWGTGRGILWAGCWGEHLNLEGTD